MPAVAGVYAWFRDGEPIHAGVVTERQGHRGRLRKRRPRRNDSSRSSLRRNAAEHLVGLPLTVSRRRPNQVLTQQVDVVNDWLATCEITQQTCGRRSVNRQIIWRRFTRTRLAG